MSSTRCFSLFIFPIAARHLFKASALFALLFSSYGAAIGMSELTVSSAVGERFYGLIGVTGTKDIAADDILVSLAPRSVYRAMDVEWEYFHTRLIFDVLVDEQESYTIRVVSSDIVFEPYLDFVVSLRSPAGSVSKQLTALLEMPAVIVQSKPIKTIKPAKPTIAPKQQHKIQRSPTIQKQKTLNESIRLESDSEGHFITQIRVKIRVKRKAKIRVK
jgi:Tfp pilus assembly protein FimV